MENEKEDRKVLRIFSASSFLNDMGSDMIQSVWPFFVTQILGASTQFLGLLDGIGDAVVALSQVVSGYISDRTKKRKFFIWLGYAFAVIGRLGYFLARTSWVLIPSKIFDRSGKMRDAPRDAILAGAVPYEIRGKSFGILRAFDNAGSVTGIILVFILIKFIPVRAIILLAIIPSIIASLLILFLIKERKEDRIKIFRGIKFSDLNKNTLLFLVTIGVFTLSTFSFSFLLLAAGKFGFGITFAPILFLLFALVTALTAVPFGRLSDIIGRKKVIAISFVLWILTSLGFLVLGNKFLIIFLFPLFGLYRGAFEPVFKTFVTELAPEEFRASVIGIFQFVIGILAFPASLIAGTLWQKFNFQATFVFSLVVAIVALILLMFVKEKSRA